MNNLFDVVRVLRERITKYRDLLSKNETLTRYVLIDPLLRALGWDTEDPEQVRPEERQEEGQPDYILYVKNKRLIAIEAKSLGIKLDESKTLNYGFRYSWSNKIPYLAITDGNTWTLYDVGEPGGRQLFTVNISEERTEEVVRKLLSLWRPFVAEGWIEPIETLK